MNVSLTATDIAAFKKELAERSLMDFIRYGWHVLEPSAELKVGWAIEAICEHLEAVTSGEIQRLLINVPPGSMKSLTTGVFWPAWEWIKEPSKRFIGTAHKEPLAIRDSRKCRNLIASEWYQSNWGDKFKLVTDQNAKREFGNDKSGERSAMAFTSMTGARGDRVALDDPLSVDDAKSEAKLKAVEATFLEALPTRLSDPEKSAIVVVMQRLHEKDPSGIILDGDHGYEHLCIPMEFEPERKCFTSIGWEDPRKEEGELFFPERFPIDVVERDKKLLGPYGTAGQFQQRPAPRGGGMFQKDWFNVVRAVPAGTRFVRGWDLAATKDEKAAWTAGVKIGRTPNGRFIIADSTRIQGTAAEVERLLKNTASQDGVSVRGSLPQDPGQAGKAQASYLVRALAGFTYKATPESGDKQTRAEPLAAQAEAGNVDILEGAWNKEFLDELVVFPFGKFKDQVDAASRAFNELASAGEFEEIEIEGFY
jgi:predicted phage terminase large subunit-like protein